MYINSEILKYAASIIVSALSFVILRIVRAMDKCEARVENCEKEIIEIKTSLGIPLSHSASV